jgi:hypothetical protein
MADFIPDIFSNDDIYEMYVSNEELTILDMSILTKLYPHIIYKILKTFFEKPKELRGYKEYKNFVKKQNELCVELHSINNELKDVKQEIEFLLNKKQDLVNLKKAKLNNYISFMNSMRGLEETDQEEEYELEDDDTIEIY